MTPESVVLGLKLLSILNRLTASQVSCFETVHAQTTLLKTYSTVPAVLQLLNTIGFQFQVLKIVGLIMAAVLFGLSPVIKY